MSICDKNIIKKEFNDELILSKIKKDYGLDNINNISSNVEICTEIFNGPTFNSNFTKLVTGLTETSIGVFNVTDNELVFSYTFTGNTDTITAYTGNFEYQIYARNSENPQRVVDNITGIVTEPPVFKDTLVYSASTPFSAITNSGFTYLETINITNQQQEYVFNSNFSFYNNDCLFNKFITTDNLKNVYDENSSLYFVTLTNPNKPILGPFPVDPPKTPRTLTVNRTNALKEETYVFAVPQTIDTNNINCELITENLTIGPVIYSAFTLSYTPVNTTLMVSVNGITLSELDYTLSEDVILTLSQNLDPNKDSINVTYLTCDKTLDVIKSENYLITGITSGVTSAYTATDKVYYNTDHNTYEYYTEYDPTLIENTLLFINGVKLTYGFDYYYSVTVNNRIIFDGITLLPNDIIHIIYSSSKISEGNYGFINSPSNILEWKLTSPTLVSNRYDGNFLVEITESSDKTFTSTATTQQINVDYVNNELMYSTTIPTGLTSNNTYIWRVINNKVYSGITGDIFTTTNISNVGKFSLGNGINSY
jgi:hypothetical protein